jgi:hypothetical protein
LPATKNGSERALRPCAVFRKITKGCRSEWGAKLYVDIRSVIEAGHRCTVGAFDSKASNSSMALQATTPEKTAPLDQRPSPKFGHSSRRTAITPLPDR